MAFTVTVTGGGASFQRGVDVRVHVLTNAAESGGATSGGANTSGAAASGSLTPNFSSSYVGFSISSDGITSMPAAASNNTYDYSPGGHTDTWVYRAGHYSGTVTAATPLTYGAGSAGSGDHENWCAYEVPSSGGTVTLDGSTPAGVFGDTSASSTTASFTPPAGSVLLVMAVFGGSGSGAGQNPTISDTSGLGLTWTRRAISSTSDNFQVTAIWTATVSAAPPAGPAGNPPLGWPPPLTQLFGPREPFSPGGFSVDAAPSLTVNAEVATVGAVAGQPSFPLYIAGLAGGTAGYFVDQHGSPRLYYAGVPWGMPANAGRWNSGNWQSDFDTYFADIAAQGMTAAEMHPWGHSHTGCNNDLGNTWDSVSPWTTIPTLNSTFWARIDYMLASALANGITVFLNLTMQCDMGMDAFSGTGVFNGTSAATLQTAAQNIAARYASQPNLIYMFGDDYNNNDDTRMSGVLTGLRAGGYTGPIAVEYYSSGTTSRRDLSGSPTGTQFPFGGSNAGFNWCYYYNVTYFAVEQAYKENSQVPVVWGDGFYVGGGAGEPADTHLMRNFVWWALASGARGCSMGSESILQWQSTAFTDLTVNQLWYINEAKNAYTAFSGFGEWYNLLPDLTNALVTAGRGSRAVYSSSDFQAADLGSDNYVAASVTPDKSLAVIYCAVAMSITIDQTQVATGYTATWVDPANGATQSTATGTTYSSSGLGNNSAGNADWVLVLQGPPAVSATAEVAAVSAVAPAPSDAVTVNAGVATVASVANAPAPAHTASAGVAAAGAVANAPAVAVTATAAVATVLVVANAPATVATVTAAAAAVSVAAPGATVSTSGSINASAGVATVAAVAKQPEMALTGTFRLMDGISGRPGNGPGSPAAYSGNFIAGILWQVTANGLWLDGYWHWVPTGGDTGSRKFALWQLTDTAHSVSQQLVPGGTVTSGTLTAGQWNYVPLAIPIGLSADVPYVACYGYVAVNGFPDTQDQFGSGDPYAAGITNGPLFAYSDQGASAPEPFTSNYNQGVFSTAGSDPAVTMPTTADVHSNFWIDVQIDTSPPAGASYRLWPSQPYAIGWVDDTADNFTLGCEFSLTAACALDTIWFYSAAGMTQLPTECGIWDAASQALVSGTDNPSPSWSGAAGSGWVSVSYTGVTLAAGDYKAAVVNAAGSPAIWNPTTNSYWSSGPGAGSVTTGPLSAPDTAHATAPGQDTYNAGASFTYPLTYSAPAAGANYWVDVEVTPAGGAVSANAGVAAVSAAVSAAGAAGTATAGAATVLAVAPGAAVNISGSTNANAGVATVSAVALAPAPADTATAGVAAAASVALAATAAPAATPGAAGVASVALQASDAITVHAGVAVIGAVAPAATVSAGGTTNAPAGVAAVSAAVSAAQGTVQATPPAAAVLAVARAASQALTANARASVVLAVAVPPPPTFVRATSSPTVTAPDTSAASVTDPRDGTASVTAIATSSAGVS